MSLGTYVAYFYSTLAYLLIAVLLQVHLETLLLSFIVHVRLQLYLYKICCPLLTDNSCPWALCQWRFIPP